MRLGCLYPLVPTLRQGIVIPAHPLALNAKRKLDESRQRALTRYYCEAGAGGIAVGVLHEILRRKGFMEGRWCLDLAEDLSPGQIEELDRICSNYPHLTEDAFVASNIERWLR